MNIEFLGQAGLCIESSNCRLLCDPWFSNTGGFLATWHQFPPNEHLDTKKYYDADFLYISHSHEDHFDKEYLKKFPKDVNLLIANFTSKKFFERIEELGFSNIIKIKDWETISLKDNFEITLITDNCKYKEDSSILINADEFRILNRNDCYLTQSYLERLCEKSIDVLFTQFSGAMWYPAAYKYDKEKKSELSKKTRSFLIDTFTQLVNTVDAKYVVPSAGPPCFLEDEFFELNFSDNGIFPDQNDLLPLVKNKVKSKISCMNPGDHVILDSNGIKFYNTNTFDYNKKEQFLRQYQKERAPIIENYLNSIPDPSDDLYEMFVEHLNSIFQKNDYLVSNVCQLIEFDISGQYGGKWQIDFRERPPKFYQVPTEKPQYKLYVDSRFLNLILNGQLLWEELFLSLRFNAERDPDVYNWSLFSLLRYGHDENLLELIELNELRTKAPTTTNVKSNNTLYKIQKFCPHLGEDLSAGSIQNGVLTCPRHNWKFDLCDNGKCVFGGNKDLKIYETSDIDSEEDSGSV